MTDFRYIANEIDDLGLSKSYICKPEECKPFLKSSINSLNILHANIRSIDKNFIDFTVFLHRLCILPDIIVLSECWLSKTDAIPSLKHYVNYHTSNHINQNDGIVIYVKSMLIHTIIEPNILDTNCLVCKIDSIKIAIIAIYRPPYNRNIDDFLVGLDDTLSSITKYENIILIGDTNINIIPERINSQGNEYLNLTAQHGLLPTHSLPTRDKNCLDHVLQKSSLESTTFILDVDLTDHLPIFHNIKTKLKPTKSVSSSIYMNYNSIYADVMSADFSLITQTLDPDVAAEMLVSTIGKIINKHSVLLNTTSKQRILKPWITKGLLRCIRNRDDMHRKLKLDPDNYSLRITYIRYRNFCNKLLKNLKHVHERHALQKANNPKATWKAIKSIIQLDSTKRSPRELLNVNSNKVSSVNSVNEYFSTVGRNLAQKFYETAERLNYIPEDDMVVNSLVLLPTDEWEIAEVIKGLRRDAAAGWDAIPVHLIQKCSNNLIPYITHICNISMSNGIFPKCFKKAIVHPIFKSGNRDNVENYRPISVLPTLSKILEKILNIRLVNFMHRNNVLAPNQFGFRRGKSTESAIGSLVDQIVDALDKRQKCLGIFLDLTKAFDTVSVPRLLLKMERMGIRGYAHRIFSDYLSGRTQCVKIDNIISDSAALDFGVPQGSVLGPTLFLLYINSLCNISLPCCSVFTYADDTALLIRGQNWREVFTKAEQNLGQVMQWLSSNQLTLNISKTSYLTFSHKALTQPSLDTYTITAHSCTSNTTISGCVCPSITRSSHIKYLGVYIDNLISWKYHLKCLTARARKVIYMFKRLRQSADMDTLKKVYYAMCQSILSYCISIWGGAAKTHFLPLERAQRAVLKVMCYKPFRYPTPQLYDECQLLTVRQLFILETIIKKHSSTKYNVDTIKKRRNYNVCNVTCFRTSLAARHHNIIGPHLYNIANNSCKIYPLSKHQCKKIIHDWLLQKSFNETEGLLKISIL